MKISIPRQDLSDAVNKVKTVVAPKSALPILSHILIETTDTGIKVSATDLKVSIECSTDCTVQTKGQLTVSSQRLSSILNELPDTDVVLELGESNVITLDSGQTHTKLFSMSPEEFPPIKDFEGIEPIVLPQSMLKNIFTKTSFAICTDQARYNLTGLLVEIKDGKLIAVATDGRRMSLYQEQEGIPDGLDIRVIIPGKMIHELERLLDTDDDVSIFIGENQAGFTFGSLRLVTALIEGTFPNYDMVIPKNHEKEATLNTAKFLEAMRRTRTMTNEKFSSVRFEFSEGTLKLKVSTPEVGEYEEEMESEYQGDLLEIAFNPDFVLDVLRQITVDSTSVLLKDSMSPGIVKPYSEAPDDKYLNVVMPIRL